MYPASDALNLPTPVLLDIYFVRNYSLSRPPRPQTHLPSIQQVADSSKVLGHGCLSNWSTSTPSR